jgi:hypothetical protein
MVFIQTIFVMPITLFHHFLTKKITIARWQLNFFAFICLTTGLITGSYLALKGITGIFATSNSSITKTTDTDFNQGTLSSLSISGTGNSATVLLSGTSGFYNRNWGYRKQIIIDHTKVSADLTDFPVLISITNASLKSTSNGGHVSQDDGDDILFIASDNLTKLSHEIEKYDSATGQLTTWVKIPTLSSSVDTTIYLYYGNVSTASMQNPTDVWSNGYVGIWHFSTGATGLSGIDSTSNEYNMTLNGVTAGSGTINGGANFDGNHYLSIGTNISALDNASNLTIELWTNLNAYGSYGTAFFQKLSINNWSNDILFFVGNDSSVNLQIDKGADGGPSYLATDLRNRQVHLVGTFDGTQTGNANRMKIYENGVQKTLSFGSWSAPTTTADMNGYSQKIGQYTNDGPYNAYGVFDEFRLSSVARTAEWVTTEYNNQLSPATFVSFGSEESVLATSGTWESPTNSNIIDLIWNGGWGIGTSESTAFSATISGVGASNTIAFAIKTANSVANLTSANYINLGTANSGTTFTKTKAELDALGVATGTARYVQVKATFAQTSDITPQLHSFTLSYLSDNSGPETNATNIVMLRDVGGSAVAQNGWTNNSAPYFSWTAGADSQSNIKGYCLSITAGNTNPNLGTVISDFLSDNTPSTLDSTHISSAGTQCGNGAGFLVTTNNIDFAQTKYRGTAVSKSWLTSSNTAYYLYIKAIDNTGNIAPDPNTSFYFRFDNTNPTNPTYFSMPSDWVSTRSVSLLWASSGDDGPQDSNSDIAGLQYRIGTTGLWYGDSHSGTQDNTDLLANDGNYSIQQTPDFTSLSEGTNNIYLRTWDNAGNASSSYISGTLKINTISPSAPRNLNVEPTDNTSNSYSFTWDTPSTFTGQASNLSYCYTINTLPTSTTCTYTGIGTTSLSADAFATQPETNTLYLVAKDEAGNINYNAYTSIAFTYSGTAPGLPRNVDVSDISIKSTSNWKLAISWDIPSSVGAGVSSYKIYRSTTNTTCSASPSLFTLIGTSAGTSYSDISLSQVTYYYCIKACDSASNCSAYSSTVSKIPTGKYFTSAGLTSGPAAGSITTKKATITWSTDRSSDSKIAFGTASNSYGSDEVSNSSQVTSHTVNLTNLKAGTTYYYKAKWTDEDGNTGTSDEKTFTTESAPTVKDVLAKNIGLSTATIQFTSKGATKIKIYYGTNTSFGGGKEISTSTTETTYTTELVGLNDGTKYYYKINTFDSESGEYEGTILDFTTLPRPKISNVRIQQVANTAQSTILVTWSTNTEVSSIITYYPQNQPDGAKDEVNIALIKGDHRLIIRGLLPETDYILVVKGRDKIGNEATSDFQSLTTATDTRPPQISELRVESSNIPPVTQTAQNQTAQLVVSWNTDEPATTQVEFSEGTGVTYSQKTQEDSNLTLNHIVIISNLSPSKVYHLRAISRDKAENLSSSIDVVTITPKATENALNLVITNLEQAFSFLGGLKD